MLREAPTAYASDHDEWARRPLVDWAAALGTAPYVASFDGDTPVGTMGLWLGAHPSNRHRATLIAVWLGPQYRGSGRAQAMLDATAEIAVSMGIVQIELLVNAGNLRAIRFYHRTGFWQIGRVPRALRHAGRYIDELMMVRPLDA